MAQLHAAAHPLRPLGVTMGEPGGVSAEITLKAWRALRRTGPLFFLIDDPGRLMALGPNTAVIARPSEAQAIFDQALPVLPVGARVSARFGVADPANAPQVLRSIDLAIDFALARETSGVVTNPIQKSALFAAGFKFPGHTEYLGAMTAAAPMPDDRPRGPVMLIASPAARIAPVTIHVPLRAVPDLLTKALIIEKTRIVIDALKRDFGIARPRIAIAGLNPHAGESGALGTEEDTVIAPAIAALRGGGDAQIAGPLSADALFHDGARKKYDAAICMYHDQALIPAKTLAFFEAVNVTLGLPIIRTSPDHGAALDIAGKDVADARSLVAALRLAAEMAARRDRSA